MYRQCPPINCQAACLGLQFSTVLSYTAQKFRSLQGGANRQNHEASQQAPKTHPMTTLMGNLHDSPPFCYVCNKMWGCLLLCSWPWMAKFCHPAIVDPFGKNRTAARKLEQVWVSLCLWLFGVSPMAGRSVTTHMSQCMVRTDGSVPCLCVMFTYIVYLYYLFFVSLCVINVSAGMCYVLVLHFKILLHFIL